MIPLQCTNIEFLNNCLGANEKNNSLPFNKYAFLTTHNAFAIEGEPSHTNVPRLTLNNQEDNVTQQLNVRFLKNYSIYILYMDFQIIYIYVY